MATIKKASKAKNLSAGPSKATPIAPKVDPTGAYTKVQERTLGNMKKGGKLGRSEKQMGLDKKHKASKEINPASFRKAQMSRDSELIAKRSGEQAPMAKAGAKVDKKWIQKAVNPKHKGYCTPMTKATCTPKRKALAMTFKKMAKARK